MRILQIVPFINPGSGLGKYVLNLSAILADSGHEMGVITTHTSDFDYEHAELKTHKATCVGQLGRESKFMMYWKCKRLIESYHPDVVIVNYDGTAQFVLPLLSHRPKIVHILHNNTTDFYRVGSINAKYVDGWIAPTQAIADRFNEYTNGKYSSKVSVIPHGVERPDIESNRQEDSKPELIFVGVHYEHKGVKLLPAIIDKLLEKGLDFHFSIVGKGELTTWLKDELQHHVASGIVTFTGIIPSQDVYKLQSRADIFVYPTHIDAFGLVIAEAMINGTVPVVTDLKGITDNLIEDGKNGFLLPQDNIDAFVDRISYLLTHPIMLATLKEQAKETALNKFTIDNMGCNYLNYLTSI